MKITIEYDPFEPEDLDELKKHSLNNSAHEVAFDLARNFKNTAVRMGFVDYDDDEFSLTSEQIYKVIEVILDGAEYYGGEK